MPVFQAVVSAAIINSCGSREKFSQMRLGIKLNKNG
jgi:hypothetical protein